MMKHLLSAICAVFLLCACGLFTRPANGQDVTVTAPAAPAATTIPEFVFPFKSDIPPSRIVRKKAELWEYLAAGFYVPLAAMRDNSKAWDLARQAQTSKAPSHVQQVIFGGIAYYRTLLGPFKTKKAAQKELKEFEKKNLVDTKLVVEYYAG